MFSVGMSHGPLGSECVLCVNLAVLVRRVFRGPEVSACRTAPGGGGRGVPASRSQGVLWMEPPGDMAQCPGNRAAWGVMSVLLVWV